MSRNFEQTHENLLISAKKYFLENGYERANLRDICKDAKVTNGAFYRHFEDKEALFGALVDPVVKAVSKVFSKSVTKHFAHISTDTVNNLWETSEDTLVEIIEYIYKDFDVFKLLLMCSGGTKYANFLDDIVRMEVSITISIMQELKNRGITVNTLDENEWHILIHAYYSSLAEVVMHNYPKEVAIKYVHTLATFFSSGWKKVLGI